MKNMVDIRFEICALIFRFVPGCGFNEVGTDYHREIDDTFAKFANHPTAVYARSLGFGYDAVSKLAVHLERRDGRFHIIDDWQSLIDCGRWNRERIETFVKLLNDFAVDTNFEEFYNAHIPFYEAETEKFIAQDYNKLNFGWFKKYLDVSRMRCIFSPSLLGANYGAKVEGRYEYSIVPHNAQLVHEYCHSFANPIAEKWYKENSDFRKLCDDTAATNKIPWYQQPITFAYEYVTRAYNILYDSQHGEKNFEMLFARERSCSGFEGFPFIECVYDMVLEFEGIARDSSL